MYGETKIFISWWFLVPGTIALALGLIFRDVVLLYGGPALIALGAKVERS